MAAIVSPTGIELGPIGLPIAVPPVVRNSDASWPMIRRFASCGKGQSRSSVATPACRWTTGICRQKATCAATTAVKTNGASSGDFSQVMAKLSNEAVDNVKKAESMSVDGIQGKADVQSVVQAVMTAQESLQTALAIRDKAVAAFQEVSRMAS